MSPAAEARYRGAVALCALASLLGPARAFAYVRTRTSTGTPVEWRQGCPQFTFGAAENPGFPTSRLRAAFERSGEAWNAGLGACSKLRVQVTSEKADKAAVAFDGTNLVTWRLHGFCDDPAHAEDDLCLAPDAAAITVVFYYDRPGDANDGELIEADVELNAFEFDYTDDGSPDKIDAQNTLTHEIGHALGLDHTCYTVKGAVVPVDDMMRPVPYCYPITALPAEVRNSTMFNFEEFGETSKRIPGPEEIRGACSVYATHTGECHSTAGACHYASAQPTYSPIWTLCVVGSILLIFRFRRRRGRHVQTQRSMPARSHRRGVLTRRQRREQSEAG